METSHCDALVFFGATGDLAYKKIFPSLQAMVLADRAAAERLGQN
jgi:glucose-6-phosphate 1-dehydrogenase